VEQEAAKQKHPFENVAVKSSIHWSCKGSFSGCWISEEDQQLSQMLHLRMKWPCGHNSHRKKTCKHQ